MSFRTLRHRFNKADRTDDRKDQRSQATSTTLEEDVIEVVDQDNMKQEESLSRQAGGEEEKIVGPPQSPEGHSSSKSQDLPDETNIFEVQLNQLQEQLMVVMIENQALQSQLNSYKSTSEFYRLKMELEYEKNRCVDLERTIDQLGHTRSEDIRRSPSHAPDVSDVATSRGAREVTGADPKASFLMRVWESILGKVYDFLDDFTTEPPKEDQGDPEGDPLTVKMLKDNIKRSGNGIKPYVTTLKGIYDLLAWKSPPYTLIVFLVYMYSVWMGWILPLLFLCLTFRMGISFLQHRGWNISFNFFDAVEEDKEKSEEKDMGVSDKLNLVMQVARKVQNVLGQVADSLEKVKSLLMWRHPEASRQLFLLLLVALIVSCILPTPLLFFYAGLLLGIKLFIIDYIYGRFPRVQRKYDSTWRLWQELPNDLEYEKKYVKSEMDKYILPHGQDKSVSLIDTRCDSLSMDDRSFCELFSLPESECPLPGWHGGRRCTLINREKSLTAAFKNGKLYLTHSFLCFERTKTPSPKNIVLPLADIARLEKAKPYGWMPGGGMAIEVAVVGNEKPFVFGAILNRDETYDNLIAAGRKASLAWASQPTSPSPPRTDASE